MSEIPDAMTLDEFREIFESVKNWGRWGPDDRRGTLNFITPDVIAAAAGLVRSGETVGCSAVIPTSGPTTDGFPPARHHMIKSYDVIPPGRQNYVMDYLGIAAHGHMFTHIDALGHMSFEGVVYGGVRDADVATSEGMVSHDLTVAEMGIVTRGILFDIPAVRGIGWLDPGESVTVEDLDAAEAAAGVRCRAGDLLLVRTGKHAREAALGPWPTLESMAGMHPLTLRWFHQRDIAVFGSDTSSDTYPAPVDGLRSPIHMGLLVAMGVHMLDNVYLEDVANTCARLERWEFMTTIAPARVPRATGMVINPIAIF